MDQLMKIAKDAGLTDEQGKLAIGGIFSLLKDKLSGADFQKLVGAVPGADSLASEAATKARSGEGTGEANTDSSAALMSSAMGMLGKLTSSQQGGTPAAGASGEGAAAAGGADGNIQGLTQLMAFLGQLGVNPSEVTKLLPAVTKFLQEHANVDAASVVTPGSTEPQSGDQGGTANLANQAKSLFGSFGKH